jgi:hypothetical protein
MQGIGSADELQVPRLSLIGADERENHGRTEATARST